MKPKKKFLGQDYLVRLLLTLVILLLALHEKISLIIVHISGDGNFHVLIFFKPDDKVEVMKAKDLASSMAYRAIELGGTCTGEHGVGVGKKEFLKTELGESSISLMRKIKLAMDPTLILNTGKVVDINNDQTK